MAGRPRIAIVGAGNLGAALAISLQHAGYTIDSIVSQSGIASVKKARRLAREVNAQALSGASAKPLAEVVWFCVPDGQIARAAKSFGGKIEWRGRIAFHSSGALTSDELASLRQRGAAIASVHPFMTFVRGSRPSLKGVPFAIEGDAQGVRAARHIVKDLGGQAYAIRQTDKAAYHAWGTFASPLFIALLDAAERVAGLAGVKRAEARRRMIPILQQTLANYAALGPAGAFSGPIIRGDADTVARHVRVLRKAPAALDAYRALVLSALRDLPTRDNASLRKILNSAAQ